MDHKLVGSSVGEEVLVEVPGAFTPTCSNKHVPGFVAQHEALKAAGADEIVCVAVHDPFVMNAWAKDQQIDGKIRMMADVQALFTKSLGMDVDLTKKLGSVRSKRYSAIIKDGKITHFNEEMGGGMTVSSAETALQQLQEQQGPKL